MIASILLFLLGPPSDIPVMQLPNNRIAARDPLPQATLDIEPNCSMPMSHNDMLACKEHDYPQAYFELEDAWAEASRVAYLRPMRWRTVGASDPMGILLARAQGEWISYRQKHCELMMLQEDTREEQSLAWSNCMTSLTRLRVTELRAYIEANTEIDEKD